MFFLLAEGLTLSLGSELYCQCGEIGRRSGFIIRMNQLKFCFY